MTTDWLGSVLVSVEGHEFSLVFHSAGAISWYELTCSCGWRDAGYPHFVAEAWQRHTTLLDAASGGL